jgi:OPA family glycerol-3-phosphate transporter-like MFS transporter
MYASFYLLRYNIYIAAPAIREQYGFTAQDLGIIFFAASWAYAFGQFINGLFTDKIGGRKAMLTGAVGTIIFNVLFGFGPDTFAFTWFLICWILSRYMQAFGAPGMIKINTAWFCTQERGKFAGIFGFMIVIGRTAIISGGPLLLLLFDPTQWEVLFYIPSVVAAVVAVIFFFAVKNTPEECGFPTIVKEDDKPELGGAEAGEETLGVLFKRIVRNRIVWIIAGAYFCTGVCRYGIDEWFPLYFKDVHGLAVNTGEFAMVGAIMSIAIVFGSFISGVISDVLLGGRRPPIAAFLYLSQVVFLLLGYFYEGGTLFSAVILIILVLLINGTHSLLGSAAAMDIGGKKGAGFASGVIDSFQYFGAGLAGLGIGWLVTNWGWGYWLISLSGFGVLGGTLMILIWNEGNPKKMKKVDEPATDATAEAS